jgi:tetratricopeptide (TPR) repeat protein
LNLSLDGADGKYGFIDIATIYSNTKAGNLANYYAGISYLKMKQYDKAIDYLSNFSSSDLGIGPIATGAIGDAFADIEQFSDAIEYYIKASKIENEFTAPLFLQKAAQLSMHLKDFTNAKKYFTKIKEEYPASIQAGDIDKYIAQAEYASKK